MFGDEGGADGSAPVLGAKGVEVFVLRDGERLDENVAETGESRGSLWFEMALSDRGEEATEGRADIAGRDKLAGKIASDVFSGLPASKGPDFFTGMAGAERRVAGAAGCAATVGESEGTEGHVVLGVDRRHG